MRRNEAQKNEIALLILSCWAFISNMRHFRLFELQTGYEKAMQFRISTSISFPSNSANTLLTIFFSKSKFICRISPSQYRRVIQLRPVLCSLTKLSTAFQIIAFEIYFASGINLSKFKLVQLALVNNHLLVNALFNLQHIWEKSLQKTHRILPQGWFFIEGMKEMS